MKHHHHQDSRNRQGFSRLEQVMSLVLVAAAVAIAWSMLSRARPPEQPPQTRTTAESDERRERTVDEVTRWADIEGGSNAPAGDGFGEGAVYGADQLDQARAAEARHPVSGEIQDLLSEAVRRDGSSVEVDWNLLGREIRSLDAASMPDAWRFVQTLPWSKQRDEMLSALIAQWARQQPADAVEFAWMVESRRQRSDAMRIAAETWAARDPVGVLNWYGNYIAEGGEQGILSLGPVYEEYYKQDRAAALASLIELPNTQLKRSALYGIFLEDNKPFGNVDDLADMVTSLETPEDRAVAAEVMSRIQGLEVPAEAAHWAMTLEETEVREAALKSALRTWSSRAPDEAFAFLENLDSTESWVGYTMKSTAYQWVSDNPYAVLRYIKEEEASPARDTAIMAYMNSKQRMDYQESFELAGSMVDAKQRGHYLENIAQKWMRTDMEQATIAVLDSEMPDQVKRSFAQKALAIEKSRTSSGKTGK